MNAQARVFTPPAPQHPTTVHFGSALQLYGYDVALDGETVELTLFWGTASRLARSYKVFVHAINHHNRGNGGTV